MRHCTRGQGSLEILLVATAVVALAFFFLALYVTTQESTMALVVAKNGLTEKLASQSTPSIIKSIRYTKTLPNQLNIVVETIPNTITLSPSEIAAVQAQVESMTSYAPVIITINP